jgi:GntR family transcriptional regulator
MTNAQYVRVAAGLAEKIRNGHYQPGVQLPSLSDIAKTNEVSDIVARKAIDLLEIQGLVRRVRRKGVFVSDSATLVRVSPERQMESAESTYRHETGADVQVERETRDIPASKSLQLSFGLDDGDAVRLTITRASESGNPVSISNTYQPIGVEGIEGAAFLEETVCDRLPLPEHAAWLGTPEGDLIKQVQQRFYDAQGGVVMISDVTYPRLRYDAMVFRMDLRGKFPKRNGA